MKAIANVAMTEHFSFNNKCSNNLHLSLTHTRHGTATNCVRALEGWGIM